MGPDFRSKNLLSFSMITETVFQWAGMGLLILQAIQFVDIPVMSSYVVLIALMFVIINLIVDLLYYIVDPRVRIESRTESHWTGPVPNQKFNQSR